MKCAFVFLQYAIQCATGNMLTPPHASGLLHFATPGLLPGDPRCDHGASPPRAHRHGNCNIDFPRSNNRPLVAACHVPRRGNSELRTPRQRGNGHTLWGILGHLRNPPTRHTATDPFTPGPRGWGRARTSANLSLYYLPSVPSGACLGAMAAQG